MLRALLLVLLARSLFALVTNTPSFAARLDRLYERIERIKPPTTEHVELTTQEPKWKLKLEKLNALTPYSLYLSPEDEDLLRMTQTWGMLSPEQVDRMAKDLQSIQEDDRSDRLADQDSDYDEMDEYLADYGEYRGDVKEDDDDDELEPSSEPPRGSLLQGSLLRGSSLRGSPPRAIPAGVTPAAFTRDEPRGVVSAVEAIAATNERPQVLEGTPLSASARATLNKEVFANIREVMSAGKCEVPQPRWLLVRQMAPAADTVYLPPCVRLHRCAADTGCCNNETEVCAPVEGQHVTLPFFLSKPDKTHAAHMEFYNHTRCACVSRATLRAPAPRRVRPPPRALNDWRPPTEQPADVDVTAPPLMRRCTCPAQFIAKMPPDGPCSCVCEWPDSVRRRGCLSLSRGDEHFGLRDRVCVQSGDCTAPACKYGPYNTAVGRCPVRKYRRLRYSRRYQPEKALVV